LNEGLRLSMQGRSGMRSVLRRHAITTWGPLQGIPSPLLAVLVGVAMGGVALIANSASSKWTVAILFTMVVPLAALVVKDIRKLLLIAFVVDMPLGLDIALQDQEWHSGGPTGYMISLMTIALIAGYAIWIMERKPKPRFFAGVTLPILLYLLMIVLSLFQTHNLQLSLFGLFLQCQFFLMYFYMANHIRTWDDVKLVMVATAICLLLEAALMLVQYFAGASFTAGAITSYVVDGSASAGATGPRVGGTIGSPNSAAAYLAPMLVITLSAYLSGKLVETKLALLACALGTVALIATATRTAWGSLILGVFLLFLQVMRTEAARKAIGILLIGGLAVGLLFGGQISERMAAVATDHTRPELATMARNIIKAFPMGIGENNYDQVMSDKYAHPNWVGHTHYPVHNKYLLVWAETGLQGLVAFAFVLLATAWYTRRWLFRTGQQPKFTILGAGFLSALAGYAFHMNTEGFSSRPNVQILWFLVGMITALTQLIQNMPAAEQQRALAGSSGGD
jgi:O-antigen ligase